MIKLFASDLDGTLLNAAHMVDPVILSAIRTVTASGAHFAIATGRTMRDNHDFGFKGVDVEAVCSNGSMILDRTGSIIFHREIDKAVMEELLRAFPGVCFECVGLDRTYVTGSPEDQRAGFVAKGPIQGIKMAAMRFRRWQMRADCEYDQGPSDVLGHEICKVNVRIPDPGAERELHAFLAEHADSVVNAPFSPVMFEITDASVSKANALEWLADHLGVSHDEVAVYGDGGNDIDMLSRFDHAYAPSNASEAAKRAAGHVIGSCAFHAVPRHMAATVRDQSARANYTRIG
ncbi:MAG: HAD family hydrolase [Collinsella sp.]|nr:HAD family hydrolase [Collinsella sp.]